MEFGVCSCLKFDSSRKMSIGIFLLLVLGFSTATEKEINEADCRPRPTVVPISEYHEHQPYYVILHRCGGACTPDSPLVKLCKAARFHTVDVVVHDGANRKSVKTMVNHTECECNCKTGPSECDWSRAGQDWQPHRCACKVIDPKTSTSVNNKVDNKTPISYIVGISGMGLLVLLVLVIDAMLYARKECGVLYCATRSCHKSNNTHDDNDNKQELPASGGGHMNGTAQYLRASRTSIV